jgi:hypothetical protein
MWTKPEYSDMRFGFFICGCTKLTTEAQSNEITHATAYLFIYFSVTAVSELSHPGVLPVRSCPMPTLNKM